MFEKIQFKSKERQETINLLDQVKSLVEKTGVESGLCLVYCPHTTAGLVVNSYLDPLTPKDILCELDRLIPTRLDFYHQNDTPSDAAGHVKASLIGTKVSFIVDEGKLVVGHSQGILFVDFDGPRSREVYVKIMAG
jgi:secondary thiamine-phosphate synthase enzyme